MGHRRLSMRKWVTMNIEKPNEDGWRHGNEAIWEMSDMLFLVTSAEIPSEGKFIRIAS